MRQFTIGDLNKHMGNVTDTAAREPVILTNHRKPRFVLMSYEHYERMRTDADPRRATTFPRCRRSTAVFSTRRSTGCRAAWATTMSPKVLPGQVIDYHGLRRMPLAGRLNPASPA